MLETGDFPLSLVTQDATQLVKRKEKLPANYDFWIVCCTVSQINKTNKYGQQYFRTWSQKYSSETVQRDVPRGWISGPPLYDFMSNILNHRYYFVILVQTLP